MKRTLVAASISVLLILSVIVAYRLFLPKVEKRMKGPLVPVAVKSLPRFADDSNEAGIKAAIHLHIQKLRQKDLDEEVRFGSMNVPRKRILRTLELFSRLLDREGIRALSKSVPKYFLVFQMAGLSQKGDVLLTGYYQPVLDAQSHSGGGYLYPLYRRPDDLQTIELGAINPKLSGERIALRVDKGIIKPYFDRRAIDSDMALEGRGLELAYLKDFLDRYMLQVQGSGVLHMENGDTRKVRYAASNCYPYVSLGKLLSEKGKIDREGMSLEAIRRYYQKHPEEIKDYLYQNHRYIFFEEFSGALLGSEGVELTPGRSIATDKRLFPGGGLVFLACDTPVSHGQGKTNGHRGLHRFMVDQDTGAAMEGPGRVDVFWGTGSEAGEIAGRFKESGKLYYLLAKE